MRRLDEARRHARDLAPATAELLAAQGWKARDLNGVSSAAAPAVTPDFASAIMSAKTLAYAVGCALIGVETFAVVAAQAPAEANRVDVLADAQQEKVYVQSFGREGGGWRALDALAVRPFAEWLAGPCGGCVGERAGAAPMGGAAAGRGAGGGRGVMGSAAGESAAAGVGAVHGRGARRPVRAGAAVPAAEFGGGAAEGAAAGSTP